MSAFVLLSPAGRPTSVLLGHMNPAAPWDHIGALDAERVAVHGKRWMIPSSHMIYGESPGEAAARILREQLELSPLRLEGPQVISEVYTPARFPDHPRHWDLEFLFRGEVPEDTAPRSAAWTELRFVDVPRTPPSDFARSHEDVLRSAGFTLPE